MLYVIVFNVSTLPCMCGELLMGRVGGFITETSLLLVQHENSACLACSLEIFQNTLLP